MIATRDRVEPQSLPPDERCGTYAGWNAHRRVGTPPCRLCKDAHNKYVREWRRRGGGPSPERTPTIPARGTGDPSADGLPAGGSPAPRGPHTSPGSTTTPTYPARGTGPHLPGSGLPPIGSPAPRGLTPDQLATLRQALNDAISYRDPGGDCTACEDDQYGLCGDHADDLAKADAYLALARELGIQLEDA